MSGELTDWGPLMPSLIGGGMAIAGGLMTQWVIARKEHRKHEREQASARAYIGAELITALEELAHRCTKAADEAQGACETLEGAGPGHGDHPYCMVYPFELNMIRGDWSVLPGQLTLQIRQLSRKVTENEQLRLTHRALGFKKLAIEAEGYITLIRTCCDLLPSVPYPHDSRLKQTAWNILMQLRFSRFMPTPQDLIQTIILVLLCFGAIQWWASPNIKSDLEKGHIWSACDVSRMEAVDMFNRQQLVLMCDGSPEVVLYKEYKHAVEKWSNFQNSIRPSALSAPQKSTGPAQ